MAETQLSPGNLFAGDFRIVRELGRGGMGAVYVAHQISTGRERALKLMHPLMVADPDLRRRFEQEATVGSRIRSEHAVSVVAAGVDGPTGIPWLAMELLEGEDLAATIRRTGPMPYPRCLDLVTQMCHALAAAHAAGIVHRDLKPENVFLAQTHREGAALTVKLLDFGIAKIVAGNPSQTASMGTPLWMAPEQAGGAIGPQADVWALGLMAFWMLTGRYYWLAASGNEAPSAIAILQEVVTEKSQAACERARRVGFSGVLPGGFDEWFKRCVDRDATRRFGNAAAARDAFARLTPVSGDVAGVDWNGATQLPGSAAVGAATSSAPPAVALTSATAPPHRRRVSIVTVLVALIVAGAAVALLRTRKRDAAGPGSAPVAITAVKVPNASTAPAIDTGPTDESTIWNLPLGNSPARGAKEPLVTIIEFGNFQCPFSKRIEKELQRILKEHSDDVRLVWKDNPLAIHSLADGAAELTRDLRVKRGDAAFWQGHDQLMSEDFSPEPDALVELGTKLGLDRAAARTVLRERPYAAEIDEDLQLADDYAVAGTPAFFINGRSYEEITSPEDLRAAVDAQLEAGRKVFASGIARKDVYAHITSGGHRGLPLDLRKYVFPKKATYVGRGNEGVKVLILQFCAFDELLCQLIDPTIDSLLKTHSRDLGVIWVDVPDMKNQLSVHASVLGRVAFQTGGVKAWESIAKRLLAAQDEEDGFSDQALHRYAKNAGLDRGALAIGFKDPELHEALARSTTAAAAAGIKAVPGFLICKANRFCSDGGYYLGGGQALRAFEKRIRLVLDAGDGPLPKTAR